MKDSDTSFGSKQFVVAYISVFDLEYNVSCKSLNPSLPLSHC